MSSLFFYENRKEGSQVSLFALPLIKVEVHKLGYIHSIFSTTFPCLNIYNVYIGSSIFSVAFILAGCVLY